MESPSLRHHCGLFGVFGDPNAAALTSVGLYALQHRGQEAAGIVTAHADRMPRVAHRGLVHQVFTPEALSLLPGSLAIGHVRYSTTGADTENNVQPLVSRYWGGWIAVAHNGNLVNAAELRANFEAAGDTFHTTSDTEVIVHLLARRIEEPEALRDALRNLEGAYSLLFLFEDRIVAVRDPLGFRPLWLGRLPSGGIVAASESSAIEKIDGKPWREIEPGEMVTISAAGVRSSRILQDRASPKLARCIFEKIYFADPSSVIFDESVHLFRVETGRRLAREAPVEADIVVPIPNCAQCAAIGYSEEIGLPYRRAFTTSHFAGRSFILPSQTARSLTVKLKLNVIREAVAGKRLVVVEDSVVRGTTTHGKISALRKAGAKEIHLRVASPPIRHPCYFGIDFPRMDDLIAHKKTVSEIRDYLEVDSLVYLSLEGLLACGGAAPESYCTACFSGRYPIQITTPPDKFALERSGCGS